MSYIHGNFTCHTQITGINVAYHLKITHTAFEGPTLYGSIASTSSVHRATMVVLMVKNKVMTSKCMMPVPDENHAINMAIIFTIFHHLNFFNSRDGHCPNRMLLVIKPCSLQCSTIRNTQT